jgi:hypothetical protein
MSLQHYDIIFYPILRIVMYCTALTRIFYTIQALCCHYSYCYCSTLLTLPHYTEVTSVPEHSTMEAFRCLEVKFLTCKTKTSFAHEPQGRSRELPLARRLGEPCSSCEHKVSAPSTNGNVFDFINFLIET